MNQTDCEKLNSYFKNFEMMEFVLGKTPKNDPEEIIKFVDEFWGIKKIGFFRRAFYVKRFFMFILK